MQYIQNTIVCAPDELREPLHKLTCMQLIRTLGKRYLELYGEIAELDVMIAALVDELALGLIPAM